jgi:hypothetical protein
VSTSEEEIKRRFNGFLRALHAYLNQLPCLHDLQKARRRWKSRTVEADAFGNFATDPEHWYTFHHGGRNEAQFNIGLCPDYLRIGLGFEFSLKKGGDPTKVQLAYTCFTNVIKASREQFERFVIENQLEVETADDIIQTGEAVSWLLNPPTETEWIFIGRLLRREEDATVLQNPDALAVVMEKVLAGFRPIWQRTQVLANTL